MRKASGFQTDELDRLLIQELEIDARLSLTALSAKLGINSTTVLRRIQRLREAGAIVFVTVVDPRALGYQALALIGIKTQSGKAYATMDALRSYSNILAIMATTGRYDIMIAAFFHNIEEIYHFVDQELGRIGNVANIETNVVLRRDVKDHRKQMSDNLRSEDEAPGRSLDDLDLKLIKELKLQPRGTITDLSKSLGTCRRTVKTRLDALQAKGVVSTFAVANLRLLGLNVLAFILVKAQPGEIGDVTSILTPETRITHIGIVAGRFDIFLWARFRDSEDMTHFVRDNLGGIPGIAEYEVFVLAGLPHPSSMTNEVRHVFEPGFHAMTP